MFDAARAALLVRGHRTDEASSKTHRGLIAAFGLVLVQDGTVDPALGRTFNRMHDIRVRADYLAGSPTIKDAEWAVSRADAFVAALREKFFA